MCVFKRIIEHCSHYNFVCQNFCPLTKASFFSMDGWMDKALNQQHFMTSICFAHVLFGR